MKPRRGSKTRHKFRFTLTVNHVTFPKFFSHKLSSSKFYIVLSRADHNSQTTVGSISKQDTIKFSQQISIESTLLKNRSSNAYLSKHCRIVLRQIKNSSNPNAKQRESSVGSIKFDLVDYISRIPSEQKLPFTKCAIDDVIISCTISGQELYQIDSYDDNMSVTSANTTRVESFMLDDLITSNGNTEQKSASPRDIYHTFEGEEDRSIQRLTDQHLMDVMANGKSHKELGKFRLKHAMDVMANERNDRSYYDTDHHSSHKRIETLEKLLMEKELKIKHFNEAERKWNRTKIQCEREMNDFEASTIELNFKYQNEKQMHRECKKELSTVELSIKQIQCEREGIENKYNNLLRSLSKDSNQLLAELGQLQSEYNDLEESLVRQQMSWRETGNILESELEKQKRRCNGCVNEMKKYKHKCHGLGKENKGLKESIMGLKSELVRVRSENEMFVAQLKLQRQNAVESMEKREESESGSNVMENIKKFSSANTTELKALKPRKRRKSGQRKRKSIPNNKFERAYMSNVNSANKPIKNKKGRVRKTKVKTESDKGPNLQRMSTTKLKDVQCMNESIEKEENIMIEQELLLSPIQNNDMECEKENEGKLSNINGSDELRNIDIGSDIECEEEMNELKRHKHLRSDNSIVLDELEFQTNDLGINYDGLKDIKSYERHSNLSEDENNVNKLMNGHVNDDADINDNLSDLSQTQSETPRNDIMDNPEIVLDID